MDAFDFSQLKRINNQANIAITGKPGGVVLVGGLVAEADIIFFDEGMTTDIQDSRRRFFQIFRDIEIACNVKAGHRLVVNLLDGKVIVVNFAGNDRFEVCFFGERVKSEHLKELLTIKRPF